jgi:4-carboxymuconolactone decarboxylase
MSTFQLDSARRSAARTTAPAFAPLEPPFAPDVNEVLTKWMPPGLNMQPLALFRLLVGHPDLASRMWPVDPAFSGEDYPEAALLVRAADELMDDSQVARATREALLAVRSLAQIIELHVLCGWYRTLATLIGSAELGLEGWAARFPEAEV